MNLKNWIRSAAGIFTTAATLLAAIITIWLFFTEDEPKAPPSVSAPIDRGTYPAFQKGSIREGADIIRLRAMSGVRELRGTEESARISKLPNGVFGYVGSRWLASYLDKMGSWPLFKERGRRDLEVHKTRGGEILVCGYVSEGDLGRLKNSAEDREVEVFVLFEPRKEYQFLVGIPVARLKEWDSRYGQELGSFAWIKVR